MNYRADIQFLRGIAVLLVIIYHLQIGIVKSGFLGVDIFFVISGFLMAVLYKPVSINQTNGVWSFWIKRAKRILPAYFATLILTLLAGFFLLLPAEYSTLVKHSLFSSWLIPNMAFWLENNYFDAQSFRPFLHFWSLGIEAQFYLIVPLIFWFFKRSVKTLIALALISFALSYLWGGRSPNSAFFLLFARFWEFMLGYFCAYFLTDSGRIKYQNQLISFSALVGLLILCCIDFGVGLRHPGPVALLACGFAAIILCCGLPNMLMKSLIGRSIEYLGKLSYSLYLVHYPILLFILYSPFQGAVFSEASTQQYLLALTLTGSIAYLLYRFVETPARSASFNHVNGTKFVSLLVSCALFCSSLGFLLNHIQRQNYTQQELAIFDSTHDLAQFRCGEWFNVTRLFHFSCSLTGNEESAQKRYLLVGNSHADAIKTTLASLAKKQGSSLRIVRHNFALGRQENTPENILKEVKKHNIDAVINHSSPNFLNLDALNTLANMAEQHQFELHHIDPVPTWDKSVPRSLWLEMTNQEQAEQKNLGYHFKQNFLERYILSKTNPNIVKRYDPSLYLCRRLCKTQNEQGQALYYDSHHLSLTGAEVLVPMFETIFTN